MGKNDARNPLSRWLWLLTGIALVSVILGVFFVTVQQQGSSPRKALIGHNGSPLLAFYYASGVNESDNKSFASLKFNSSADVGYALLSGSIHAGFIEPDKVLELRKLTGFDKLEILGKVTFPYGVTVITKKGSTFRLQEINSHSFATPSDNPRLLGEFRKAVSKYPVKIDKVNFIFLPNDAIIPALEAGKIEGAIIKGSQAVLAVKEGHNILFQKWDMQPGNECCPPVIDQLEFILLARKNAATVNAQLTALLKRSTTLSPSILRRALSKTENVSDTLFADLPLASYEPADDQLLTLFARHSGHNAEPNHHIHNETCGHIVQHENPKNIFEQVSERVISFFSLR